MDITLYTIHCPQCIVLKKKLDIAGITYATVDDKQILTELGYDHFPILKVCDTEMDFYTAKTWLEGQSK